SLFNFFLALIFGQLLVGQRRVRLGVRTDGVAGGVNLFEDFRSIGRVLADREEDASRAFFGKPLEHRRRVFRPGPVVGGQHHVMPDAHSLSAMIGPESIRVFLADTLTRAMSRPLVSVRTIPDLIAVA